MTSNLRVCKLIMVAINSDVKKGQSKQNNKYYNMFEQDGGTFRSEYGRVDSKCQTRTYPISKWEGTIRSKLKKKYKDVTHLFHEDDEDDNNSESKSAEISDIVIKNLFSQLQSYANNTIQQNYKVSSSKVTQSMVDEAQKCVDLLVSQMKNGKNTNDLNKTLLDLYHIIPRKMRDVQDYLLEPDKSISVDEEVLKKAESLIDSEQSTLDVMAGQVIVNTKTKDDSSDDKVKESKTLLDILGLLVCETDSDEDSNIRNMMGPNSNQFRKAYAIINKETQTKYDKNLFAASNNKSEMFWHGSRNQNWLNIISTGLLIRPSGAIHTGSMFGDGIYFADKAQKSIGYSSLRGSCWSRGGDDKAYLALFSVHTGNQKDIKRHDSSCYRLSSSVLKQGNYDSVFAHGGMDLRNNEYIVYEPQQCTISYIVEIGS